MPTTVVLQRSASAPDRTSRRRDGRRGAAAMVGAATSWGVGTAVTKLALQRTGTRPLTLQALELLASVAILTVVAASRRRWPSKASWRQGRAGLLEPGASNVLALAGLAVTAATHASIIAALEPVLVVGGAWLFLRRALTARIGALMTATFAGAALAVASGPSAAGGASPAGDGLVLAGVACGAAYALVVTRTVRRGSPLTLALTQQVWALALVLPAAAVTAAIRGVGALPHGTDLLLVLASGLLSYLVPFALYLAALRAMPATEATQFLAFIPVAGLGGAALLLGEPLTSASLSGGGVMVAALCALARPGAGHR